MENNLVVRENDDIMNDIITVEEDGFIAQLNGTKKNVSFCTMVATTPEEKAELFEAMNGSSYKISECINTPINLKDIFVEIVECVNAETGESQKVPRTVLIDTEGESYSACSKGIFTSIAKLLNAYGVDEIRKGLTVYPKAIEKGQKRILSLTLKAPAKKVK